MKRMIAAFGLVCILAICGCEVPNECAVQDPPPKPVLVLQKDGVSLYKVYDKQSAYTVYFTTPSGDTTTFHLETDGESTRTETQRTSSVQTKQEK